MRRRKNAVKEDPEPTVSSNGRSAAPMLYDELGDVRMNVDVLPVVESAAEKPKSSRVKKVPVSSSHGPVDDEPLRAKRGKMAKVTKVDQDGEETNGCEEEAVSKVKEPTKSRRGKATDCVEVGNEMDSKVTESVKPKRGKAPNIKHDKADSSSASEDQSVSSANSVESIDVDTAVQLKKPKRGKAQNMKHDQADPSTTSEDKSVSSANAVESIDVDTKAVQLIKPKRGKAQNIKHDKVDSSTTSDDKSVSSANSVEECIDVDTTAAQLKKPKRGKVLNMKHDQAVLSTTSEDKSVSSANSAEVSIGVDTTAVQLRKPKRGKAQNIKHEQVDPSTIIEDKSVKVQKQTSHRNLKGDASKSVAAQSKMKAGGSVVETSEAIEGKEPPSDDNTKTDSEPVRMGPKRAARNLKSMAEVSAESPKRIRRIPVKPKLAGRRAGVSKKGQSKEEANPLKEDQDSTEDEGDTHAEIELKREAQGLTGCGSMKVAIEHCNS